MNRENREPETRLNEGVIALSDEAVEQVSGGADQQIRSLPSDQQIRPDPDPIR